MKYKFCNYYIDVVLRQIILMAINVNLTIIWNEGLIVRNVYVSVLQQ